MLRTFREHEVRPVESLDGRWDFVTAEERTGRAKLPRRYGRSIQVPSVWEMLPGLEAYRGRAWFRTRVRAKSGRALRLVFGGVSHTGTVYLNGQPVASHYDAFTPWQAVVAGLAEGEHELVVEVDNTFGPHSALHKENDYYTYGGIARPVVAEQLSEAYIDLLHARPRRLRGRWQLDLRIRLANWSDQPQRRRVRVQLAEATHDLGEATVPAGGHAEIAATLKGLDLPAWSLDAPVLHTLRAQLLDGPAIVDDQIDRIGLREVKVLGRKLLLNGQPIRLRGYNRHEDHPQFGCALPVAAMAHDLELVRDLGCNFVRTCHYPNDQRFLDLCDELGLAVWEESHARGVPFDAPRFRDQIADSTREMVQWHYNRPCILIWGCLNECDSASQPGREEHRRVIELLRSLDDSRPVTFATNKGTKDLCLDLVDIVSFNCYPGWYGGAPADIEPALRELLAWLGSDASGGKGKPVILSEFGAGGLYGHRHPNRAHWTEQYQCDVLDECLRVYLHHRDLVGAAIWQFADCRITDGHWKTRPRTMNNKGTVDEYRRPKLVYEVVRRRMREAAGGA